jgi:hypothetical protein
MLGVQRPTVSVVAATLQEAGLIRYIHGHVTVLNRKGLEAAACECYRIIRTRFDRLARQPIPGGPSAMSLMPPTPRSTRRPRSRTSSRA